MVFFKIKCFIATSDQFKLRFILSSLHTNVYLNVKDIHVKRFPFPLTSDSVARPASEYSSPGRPLSCIVDENTPITTNGATPTTAVPVTADDQRAQERRARSQRHRNYMSRTHLHTPPDLPEGYG